MNASIDILRGELERLYSLEDLTSMSSELLGLDPAEVGGESAKASFARSLAERCVEGDRVEALVDILASSKRNLDPRVFDIVTQLDRSEAEAGKQIGSYVIERILEDSSWSFSAIGQKIGQRFAIKALSPLLLPGPRAMQRFLTTCRMIAATGHAGLPKALHAFEHQGSAYVAYGWSDTETLRKQFARTGPRSPESLSSLLRGILEPLGAIHKAGLCHGDLRMDNVLVSKSGEVTLVDFGWDKLRRMNGSGGVYLAAGAAPELMRGKAADARSDVYAFGVVLYELLTGKSVFDVTGALETSFAHFHNVVVPPSERSPSSWMSPELDAFLVALLDKDPARRPKDALAVLQAFERLENHAPSSILPIDPEQVQQLLGRLETTPDDAEAALALERSVATGADYKDISGAFLSAADKLVLAEKKDLAKVLMFRAARTLAPRDQEAAAGVYTKVLALDASDEVAAGALEEIRRSQGKFEELIEMWLERSQALPAGSERGRALSEIGRIYSSELSDDEQALVAYTQALCEHPSKGAYAVDVERLAGDPATAAGAGRWNEVLSSMTGAIQEGELAGTERSALLDLAGRWYEQKLGRSDLALFAYQQVLQAEPQNETAMAAMSGIYRKAQQWQELYGLLVARADAAGGHPRGRDLRVEAAEVLETRLNDAARAKPLYERILAEDPGHGRASEALARIYEKEADHASLVAVLQKRADSRRGPEQGDALVRVAEVYEDQLNDLSEATQRYEAVLRMDPKHMSALKGLDRIYNRTGRYKELMEILERQVLAAATARQKIALYERMASLLEEEFINNAGALDVLEKIIALEPKNEKAIAGAIRNAKALGEWERAAGLYDKHAEVAADDNTKVEVLLAKGRMFAESVMSPERAMRAYEDVLKVRPDHNGALEALAQLKETSGDAHAALSALEALANKASTPEAKAEQWMRAGKLLESKGDRDGAIERYKLALEASPKDVAAAAALRKAYLERGDSGSVVTLIERELEFAEGNLAKARLYAELARVYKTKVGDSANAAKAAKKAGELDGSNAEAALILGDIAYEENRLMEAGRFYESLVSRVQALPREDGTRVLVRYVEVFGKTTERPAPLSSTDGRSVPPPPTSSPKLVAAVEQLGQLAQADVRSLAQAASVLFEHGDPKLVNKIYVDLFARHDGELRGLERAEALYHLGESARRSGDFVAAIPPLREAVELDKQDGRALRSLGRIFDETGDWEEAVRMRRRRLDIAKDDERFDLYLEIGDIEFTKLGNRELAQRTYGKALEQRPDDRKLLGKLMQIYSEGKDWAKLVDVVTRLADFVEDKKQRAKYMHTAATISSKHLNANDRAILFYASALEFDPSLEKAADELVMLQKERGLYADAERTLNGQLDVAKDAGNAARMVVVLDELGALYQGFLKDTELAIDAYEAAQAFDPSNEARPNKLADIYASDPTRYLEKAVRAQAELLRGNPYRVESYKLLRKLYTDSKNADSAWCLCQALTTLNLAAPDEERFFRKHAAVNAAAAQAVFDEDAWGLLTHPDLDLTLTKIFALLTPCILQARTQSLVALGYAEHLAVDITQSQYPVAQTLYYAGGVLGLSGIPVFQNTNDPGGIGFIHAQHPSIVLGAGALSADMGTQSLAFFAGRHLSFYRAGFLVRHLLPTGTALKAWLFAAIKHCVPAFPVSAEQHGQVAEALGPIAAMFQGMHKDALASAVSKLLNSGGAIDLKKWVAAVDMTGDRTGFLLAHDLSVATDAVRVTEEGSAVAPKERLKELVLFCVSDEYFKLRRKLGIAIDS
jgi:tetratricopeptide (TPR) repeat protein